MAASGGDVGLDEHGGRGVESERFPLMSCLPLCMHAFMSKRESLIQVGLGNKMPANIQRESVAFTAAVLPPAIGMPLADCLTNPSKGQQPYAGTHACFTLKNGRNATNSPSVQYLATGILCH